MNIPHDLGLQDLILGLAHIGYITTDMRALVDQFRHIYELREDQVQVTPPYGEPCLTRFAFIEVGGARFELIEPVDEKFKALLLTDRPGINHVAWKVSDIDAVVERMKHKGVRPGHVTPNGWIETPSFKMAYFDPEDTGGMLIEVIEYKDEAPA